MFYPFPRPRKKTHPQRKGHLLKTGVTVFTADISAHAITNRRADNLWPSGISKPY